MPLLERLVKELIPDPEEWLEDSSEPSFSSLELHPVFVDEPEPEQYDREKDECQKFAYHCSSDRTES